MQLDKVEEVEDGEDQPGERKEDAGQTIDGEGVPLVPGGGVPHPVLLITFGLLVVAWQKAVARHVVNGLLYLGPTQPPAGRVLAPGCRPDHSNL